MEADRAPQAKKAKSTSLAFLLALEPHYYLQPTELALWGVLLQLPFLTEARKQTTNYQV